jgi:hypothetical protein
MLLVARRSTKTTFEFTLRQLAEAGGCAKKKGPRRRNVGTLVFGMI